MITGFTVSGDNFVGFVGNATRGYQLLLPPRATDAGNYTFCLGINNAAQVACLVTDLAENSHSFIGSPEGQEGEN